MPYTDHFQLADDYITHLDTALVAIPDPFIRSRYTGFLAVSAVTVYELAIKNIFIDFAQKKHRVLSNFTNAYFERINGRIKIEIIQKDYISKYGEKYSNRFVKKLTAIEDKLLRSDRVSVKACYGNIVTWRNDFAHEGRIPPVATYDEMKKAYLYGKQVIHCLHATMQR